MKPFIVSVHGSGKNRGTRIYFNSRDLRKIEKKYGEEFFLFKNKKLLAYIDPIKESIWIKPLETWKRLKNITITRVMDSYNFIDDELDFAETEEYEFDFDSDGAGLDFYLPIEGTGDKYLIAEVSIRKNLCYYCVSTSLSNLKKEIQRKGDKHFPGLLKLRNSDIKYLNDYLVHSPVLGYTARNAFSKVKNKKINNVEIPAYISIPNDAELTPLINMDKGNIKDLKIRKRDILAKYEITAIASNFAHVENTTILEINNEIFWKVLTNKGELFFNPMNGKKIEEIKEIKVV
ncbi:MAG: hypothetical protein HWN67_09890 [Candidatus Helarchaeota archaeon]|nr:hypothetical protein [Candidatus Helarchaeota archaeon]